MILIGILIIILLVCLFGIILILSYDFFTNNDGKNIDYNGIMPGINCGICGYLGCNEYLNAIITDNEKHDLCNKDDRLSSKLDVLMVKSKITGTKYVAKIFCLGDNTAKTEYIYNGADSCRTVYSFYNGNKICKDACLGKGDCMNICPENAVRTDEKNRFWIDSNLCTGCGLCIKICPPRVIKLVPEDGGYFIACSNHNGEKFVTEQCGKGCIGCGRCEVMVSDSYRIVMDDNLAVVRYNSKRNIIEASSRCPTDVIVPIRNQKAFMRDQKTNKSEL